MATAESRFSRMNSSIDFWSAAWRGTSFSQSPVTTWARNNNPRRASIQLANWIMAWRVFGLPTRTRNTGRQLCTCWREALNRSRPCRVQANQNPLRVSPQAVWNRRWVSNRYNIRIITEATMNASGLSTNMTNAHPPAPIIDGNQWTRNVGR